LPPRETVLQITKYYAIGIILFIDFVEIVIYMGYQRITMVKMKQMSFD